MTRPREPRGRALVVLALTLGACGAPVGVEPIATASAALIDPATRIELVPPIKLPTRRGGTSRTRIFVSLPPGGEIDLDQDAGGDPSDALIFPPGAVLDRVEETWSGDAWIVADVRGTTVTERGQRFHLLRPDGGDGSALWGYSWPADSAELDRWAHDAIATDIEAGRGLPGRSDEALRRDAAGLRERADCMRCHEPLRPDDLDARAIVHRGTDRSGFHVPAAVFREASPLERYRAHDPNAPAEALTVTCSGTPARPEERAGTRRWTCDDGAIPVATLDVAAALARGDAHALAVCRSRQALARRMSARAIEAIAPALAACASRR